MTESTESLSYRSAGDIFRLVDSGALVLPDFQRPFEWKDDEIGAFLATVLRGLPSGTLLFGNAGSLARVGDAPLHTKSLDLGSETSQVSSTAKYLLLDGQQRVTALYRAVRGARRYFVDIEALEAGDDILTDGVVFSTRSSLRSRTAIPVEALWDNSSLFAWLDSIDPETLRVGSDSKRMSARKLVNLISREIRLISQYQFAVLELGPGYSASDTAIVFERLNKYGQELKTFDLMAARLASSDFPLRLRLEEVMDGVPGAESIFAHGDALLSSIAIAERGDPRRSAILALRPETVESAWKVLPQAVERTTRILSECGVVGGRYLPYQSTANVMLAALLAGAVVSDLALTAYFSWSSFTSRYSVASNTRMAEDFRRLVSGEGFALATNDLPSRKQMAAVTRRRNAALWRAIVGLVVTSGALDLQTGEDLRGVEAGRVSEFGALPHPLRHARKGFDRRAVLQAVGLDGLSRAVRNKGLRDVLGQGEQPQLLEVENLDDRLGSQLLTRDFLADDASLDALLTLRSELLHQEMIDRCDGLGLVVR